LPEQMAYFSQEEEQAIYRIIQESLENVLRHASAKNVWVTMENKDNMYVFTIRDDGIGFDFSDQERYIDRLGIQGMRERAETIGALFSIFSSPGKGTKIELKMRAS